MTSVDQANVTVTYAGNATAVGSSALGTVEIDPKWPTSMSWVEWPEYWRVGTDGTLKVRLTWDNGTHDLPLNGTKVTFEVQFADIALPT